MVLCLSPNLASFQLIFLCIFFQSIFSGNAVLKFTDYIFCHFIILAYRVSCFPYCDSPFYSFCVFFLNNFYFLMSFLNIFPIICNAWLSIYFLMPDLKSVSLFQHLIQLSVSIKSFSFLIQVVNILVCGIAILQHGVSRWEMGVWSFWWFLGWAYCWGRILFQLSTG